MSIRHMTRAFARPDNRLGVFHLVLSLAMYIAALCIGTWAWGQGMWWLVAATIPLFFAASGRLFGVQHDCGHLSYFSSHRANVITGVLLGGITYNPYFAMRYNHNRHHAYIGNLDQMDSHEVLTWTVRQYAAAGPWQRLYYRIYRSWAVIFFIGPWFVLFIRYRWPKNAAKSGILDVIMQNSLMAAFWWCVWFIGGPVAVSYFMTALLVSACVAVFIVYIGHNHEETYWQREGDVDFEEASLQGASVIDLGPVYDFMTFNFAYHDLHHLNARIPAYRLKACHVALSPHLNPQRLGFRDAVRCIRWKLWDEDLGRMVTFRQAEAPALQPAE